MRFDSGFKHAIALLIPLACASCSSKPQSSPAQPVAAPLTYPQAATLARDYLDQHSVPSSGMFTAEAPQPDGWWLYYQTPFSTSAQPPSLSYLIQVHNDGTVDQLH